MVKDDRPFYTTKTFTGMIVFVVSIVLGHYGIDTGPLSTIGLAFAGYGAVDRLGKK